MVHKLVDIPPDGNSPGDPGDVAIDPNTGITYSCTAKDQWVIMASSRFEEEETIEEKVEKLTLKTDLLLITTAGLIDNKELRRLLNMMRSPDEENHVLVKEIINNKLKEI